MPFRLSIYPKNLLSTTEVMLAIKLAKQGVSGRHCEQSEAIQSRREVLDCFVASAPRNDGQRNRALFENSGALTSDIEIDVDIGAAIARNEDPFCLLAMTRPDQVRIPAELAR